MMSLRYVFGGRRGFHSLTKFLERRESVISSFKALPEIRLNDKEVTKSAAVLIALCEDGDRVSLLYTLRSKMLRNHTRQVSFPGGILDPAVDRSYEDCALRETEEETGIPRDRIRVWGTGNVMVPFKGKEQEQVQIVPVIGSIEKFSEVMLVPSREEVEKVFTVELSKLADLQLRRHTQFRSGRGYSTPVYVGGEERIWGMTAILTHLFLSVLLPREVYQRKIPHVPQYRAASTH